MWPFSKKVAEENQKDSLDLANGSLMVTQPRLHSNLLLQQQSQAFQQGQAQFGGQHPLQAQQLPSGVNIIQAYSQPVVLGPRHGLTYGPDKITHEKIYRIMEKRAGVDISAMDQIQALDMIATVLDMMDFHTPEKQTINPFVTKKSDTTKCTCGSSAIGHAHHNWDFCDVGKTK